MHLGHRRHHLHAEDGARRGYPFLTYASIALVGGGSVFFLLIPMTRAVITQDGPFSYSGIGAFWFPVFIFFGEIVVMIAVSFRVINQQAATEQALADAANPTPASPAPTPVAGA